MENKQTHIWEIHTATVAKHNAMKMKTTMSVTAVQQDRGHVRRSACQGQQLYWRFFLPQVQKQVGLSQGD